MDNRKLKKMIENVPSGLEIVRPKDVKLQGFPFFRQEVKKDRPRKLEPTAMQWQVIYLHLNGKTRDEISDEMGIPPSQVTRYLSDERSQMVMSEYFRQLDMDLQAMFGRVVFNMGNLLESKDPHVVLKAMDVWNRMHGKYTVKVDIRTSAEDVVKKLIEE